MNTLRSISSALKTGSSLLNGTKQLKQQDLCCLKRAATYTTAVFIRNTGASTQPGTIYANGGNFNSRQSLLLPKLQSLGCAPIYNTHCLFGTKNAPDYANKSDTKSAAITEADLFGETSKLGLFAKFKLMYKKYWYVLIPVHVVTSAGWMCGFYYLSKRFVCKVAICNFSPYSLRIFICSGVDVPSLLQYLHLSETIIEKVQNSNLGHWAVAYLCYKVATPVRYAVTLGKCVCACYDN